MKRNRALFFVKGFPDWPTQCVTNVTCRPARATGTVLLQSVFCTKPDTNTVQGSAMTTVTPKKTKLNSYGNTTSALKHCEYLVIDHIHRGHFAIKGIFHFQKNFWPFYRLIRLLGALRPVFELHDSIFRYLILILSDTPPSYTHPF